MRVGGGIRVGMRDDYDVTTHGCGGRFDHILVVFFGKVVVMNDDTFLDGFWDGCDGNGVDISDRG